MYIDYVKNPDELDGPLYGYIIAKSYGNGQYGYYCGSDSPNVRVFSETGCKNCMFEFKDGEFIVRNSMPDIFGGTVKFNEDGKLSGVEIIDSSFFNFWTFEPKLTLISVAAHSDYPIVVLKCQLLDRVFGYSGSKGEVYCRVFKIIEEIERDRLNGNKFGFSVGENVNIVSIRADTSDSSKKGKYLGEKTFITKKETSMGTGCTVDTYYLAVDREKHLWDSHELLYSYDYANENKIISKPMEVDCIERWLKDNNVFWGIENLYQERKKVN